MQLEDRTTPTTVNATAISDAYESGTDGIIRVSRDGDTSYPLGVGLMAGGTATVDEDYEGILPAVTIPAGESSVDVHVVPIWNGIANTNSRTVGIDIVSDGGEDYDAGTSATVSIQDDIDFLPIVVHQSTFQLSGSAGPVNVSLTVTYTAATYIIAPEAVYTWVYQVQNPDPPTGTTTWTSFAIPVDSSAGIDDVWPWNLQGPAGWTGTVGADNVTFTADSGGLAPGDTATFSFTTAPRFVAGADVSVSDGGANVADLPTAPAPRQKAERALVNITFIRAGNMSGQQYTLNLTMQVADGSRYTTGAQAVYSDTNVNACFTMYTFLKNNGWEVVRQDNLLIILGKHDSSGKIIGITKLNYSVTALNGQTLNPPAFLPNGQVDLINDNN